MAGRSRRYIWSRLPLVVGLLLALLGGQPIRPARAAGTFTVNSTADTSYQDSVLTLREALQVANGVLVGYFTDAEKAQLGGCTFYGSAGNWGISGGCGAGIADTINFSFSTGVITLSGALPGINDTAPTYLYGPNATASEIAIDGLALPAGTNILNITSDNNQVYDSLAFRNGPAVGVNITGNNNQLYYTQVYGNDSFGVKIDGGDNNEIYGNEVGFRSLESSTSCVNANRNGSTNVAVVGGAQGNTLAYNTIVCSPLYGIGLSDAGTTDNTITGNFLGVWLKSGSLYGMGNNYAGIGVFSGSHANQLTSNLIGRNAVGILVNGSGSDQNILQGNYIGGYYSYVIPNTQAGILITNGPKSTQVLDNTIANNANAGVTVDDTIANETLIEGNDIFSNSGAGVLLSGSTSHNVLRSNEIYSNSASGISLTMTVSGTRIENSSIHDNGGAGISESATAGPNWWTRVHTYSNGGLGIDRLANGIPDEPYPVITGMDFPGGGTGTVSGQAEAGSVVELYRVAADPSGFGEGRVFVNSANADAAGHWQIVVPSGEARCFSALQRKLLPAGWIASEYGPNTACIFLPFVSR